jgi:hypothetical protein
MSDAINHPFGSRLFMGLDAADLDHNVILPCPHYNDSLSNTFAKDRLKK